MLSYSTLHELAVSDPALEILTIESDIRDLGVREPYCTYETSKSAHCKVVMLAGPEIRNLRTGKVHKAGWIL